MKQGMIKTGVLLAVGCAAGVVQAGDQLGIGFGSAFNYKATFSSEQVVMPFANDPGAAVAGIDHSYDDGYNRVDSTANSDRGTGISQTTYWGYDNTSQYDPTGTGAITMNSDRSILDAQGDTAKQEDGLGALEIFWLHDFTERDGLNFGIRLAGRWQRVRVSKDSSSSTTIETTSDAYDLNNVVPASAPFAGSFTGPNATLGDTPTRSVSTSSGPSILVSREVDGYMLACDLGPTVSIALGKKTALVASVGATAAHIHSDFIYTIEDDETGQSTDTDWLFGAYASADLHYQTGEKWGLFTGISYNYLDNFSQQAGSQKAELELDGTFAVRLGFYTAL